MVFSDVIPHACDQCLVDFGQSVERRGKGTFDKRFFLRALRPGSPGFSGILDFPGDQNVILVPLGLVEGLTQLVLSTAGIVEANAKHMVEIDFGDDEILLKGFPPAFDRSFGADNQTLAIEYELVLSSHHIHIGDIACAVDRPGTKHAFADFPLPCVKGGGGEIQDAFGIPDHRLGIERSLRVPDIFTDVDSQSD
jgi:hypothetical protein